MGRDHGAGRVNRAAHAGHLTGGFTCYCQRCPRVRTLHTCVTVGQAVEELLAAGWSSGEYPYSGGSWCCPDCAGQGASPARPE